MVVDGAAASEARDKQGDQTQSPTERAMVGLRRFHELPIAGWALSLD